MTAPRFLAARRITSDDEGPAVPSEIAGIRGLFEDLPQPCQANAVWMNDSPKALTIGAPSQIGSRVDRSRNRLTEEMRQPGWQNPPERARQAHAVDRDWRLARGTPDPLVRVRE